ncbi:MAG TPA: hypothetical protein VG501_07895 [Rhizomicrobium sp.]|nr:hypothetical protein [Rhizomicrobium sp.]
MRFACAAPRLALAAGMAALAALAGCGTANPGVNLSPDFKARSQAYAWNPPDDGAAGKSCRIRLTEIRDLRDDKEVMGSTGFGVVTAPDMPAWLNSGLQSLKRDKRIVIADGPDADLDIGLDLIRAYMMHITTDLSTNLVARVHFTRHGAATEDKLFRGAYTRVNWGNGKGEVQAAFDEAFEDLLKTLDSDIRARCAPVVTGT